MKALEAGNGPMSGAGGKVISKLEELKKLLPDSTPTHRSLDRETGLEVITAYRRGVRVKLIGEAVGVSSGNIYSALGTWALRHCQCWKEGK